MVMPLAATCAADAPIYRAFGRSLAQSREIAEPSFGLPCILWEKDGLWTIDDIPLLHGSNQQATRILSFP